MFVVLDSMVTFSESVIEEYIEVDNHDLSQRLEMIFHDRDRPTSLKQVVTDLLSITQYIVTGDLFIRIMFLCITQGIML